MTSIGPPRCTRLSWEEIDRHTNQRIQREFSPTEETWGLLRGIWKMKVYYLNSKFNYGRDICNQAIQDSKRNGASQVLNYKIIRVSSGYVIWKLTVGRNI